MANNNILFNAALNGVGGAIFQRWLISATAADYLRYRSAMVAFATSVDAAIAPATLSQQDADLLQSICAGILGNRDINSFVSADYDTIAASILAMYTELQGSLLPVTGGDIGIIRLATSLTFNEQEFLQRFVISAPGVTPNVWVSLNGEPSLAGERVGVQGCFDNGDDTVTVLGYYESNSPASSLTVPIALYWY